MNHPWTGVPRRTQEKDGKKVRENPAVSRNSSEFFRKKKLELFG